MITLQICEIIFIVSTLFQGIVALFSKHVNNKIQIVIYGDYISFFIVIMLKIFISWERLTITKKKLYLLIHKNILSMNKTIGKRIRNFREAKGFSQEELAERLKISRSAYQRLENGETNSWINHIESICDTLEVTVDELLKTDDGNVQINTENSANESSNNNMIQNQTNNYNLPDKLIEQYETRIIEYKEEITALKERIKNLEAGF